MTINDALTFVHGLIDVAAASGSAYSYKHNGGPKTLSDLEDLLLDFEWRDARVELPPDENEVLVVTQSKKGCLNIDKGYYFMDRWVHRGTSQVIRWMPLPALPNDLMEGWENEGD